MKAFFRSRRNLGWFNQVSGECRSQCRLAEAVGAGDLAVEFGFEVVDGGGAGFDFGDDLVLFGEGRKPQLDGPNVIKP